MYEDVDEGTPVVPPAGLPDVLPHASVVVLALPATVETAGVMGAAEFALLPKPACVVNVGRANACDEDALWGWLSPDDGASYAGDVWWQELKMSGSAGFVPGSSKPGNGGGGGGGNSSIRVTANAAHTFESMRNVVMTPHCAGGMGLAGVESERANYTVESIVKIAQGTPRRPVSLSLSY